MARKKFLLGMLAMVLVFGMTVVGCGDGAGNSDGDTHSIIIAEINYVEFETLMQPFDPGFTINVGTWSWFSNSQVGMTTAEFDQFNAMIRNTALGFSNITEHNWTRDQLEIYFLDIGFGHNQANEAALRVVSSRHQGIASRTTGNTVFALLK